MRVDFRHFDMLILFIENLHRVFLAEVARALPVLSLNLQFLIALPPLMATAPMLLIETQCLCSFYSQYVRNASSRFAECCENLSGERHKRETLKRLLVHARNNGLQRWCELFTKELTSTRQRINRLFACKTRLKRKLDSALAQSSNATNTIG